MAEGERVYITRKKNVLNRQQKAGFIMIAAFGALALIFGPFYLWKHIASPFVISYVGPKFLTGDDAEKEKMETLKKQDTDSDSIDDYRELYVYKTSPYLKDSDSDGTEDNIELAQGQDPNCAPSMPCATLAVDAVTPETLQGTFAEDVAVEAGASAAPAATPADVATAFAQMTVEELRKILVDAGGDPVQINALTEEELRAVLTAALAQMDTPGTDVGADDGSTNPAPDPESDTATPTPQTTE